MAFLLTWLMQLHMRVLKPSKSVKVPQFKVKFSLQTVRKN